MQDDPFAHHFAEELIAQPESPAQLGGSSNEQVHRKASRAGETYFRGRLCARTLVRHDHHQVDIRVCRRVPIRMRSEKDHAGGAETAHHLIDKTPNFSAGDSHRLGLYPSLACCGEWPKPAAASPRSPRRRGSNAKASTARPRRAATRACPRWWQSRKRSA